MQRFNGIFGIYFRSLKESVDVIICFDLERKKSGITYIFNWLNEANMKPQRSKRYNNDIYQQDRSL